MNVSKRQNVTLALAAAGLIALGGAAAIAQQPAQPGGTPQIERSERGERGAERREERMRERGARMQERFDRRLEQLKTDLALTDAQKPLWDRVEAQIKKNMADRRASAQTLRDRMRAAELPDRLDLMAEAAAQRAARARELSELVKPLWATMSGSQKALVRNTLSRGTDEGEGRGRWRQGEGGGAHSPHHRMHQHGQPG